MSDPILEAATRALLMDSDVNIYVQARTCDVIIAAVAPLLRAAALEEAALVAHQVGWYSQAYLDGDLPDDVVIHNRACWAIRDKLRALKEQS